MLVKGSNDTTTKTGMAARTGGADCKRNTMLAESEKLSAELRSAETIKRYAEKVMGAKRSRAQSKGAHDMEL